MRATYRALCKHGYADLTIQRIGDEFDKSKSLLYHHYDGKDALLVDFLGFMLERFEENATALDGDDAYARLQSIIDFHLPRELDAERAEFTRAMVELRSQATHDPAYREQFTRSDGHLQSRIADVVREGIDEGVFRDDVDPDDAAASLWSGLYGAIALRATTDNDTVEAVRRELDGYVRSHLLADDADDAPDDGTEVAAE